MTLEQAAEKASTDSRQNTAHQIAATGNQSEAKMCIFCGLHYIESLLLTYMSWQNDGKDNLNGNCKSFDFISSVKMCLYLALNNT